MRQTLCLLILVLIVFYMLLTTAGCSEQKKTEIPDWVLNPPEDENYLYAVGTGRSKDLRIAIRIARQEGRTELAAKFKEMKTKLLRPWFARLPEEVGVGEDSELLALTTSASEAFVSETIIGCKASKQEVKKDGAVYRAYVLMEKLIGKAPAALKVYGYGFSQKDAATEEKQKLSAYLAAIGDACRELLAFQEVSISAMYPDRRKESSAQAEEVVMRTRVSKSKVNGEIGNRLKVCGETRLFEEVLDEDEERNEKSETHHLFQDWIKFEYEGNLILIYSTQTHLIQPDTPDITKIVNRVETPNIELIDTEGIEKALDESGIKIEKVEYLGDGLCKVTLLQLTYEFLTTLDTKDIVPPSETSVDKMHTIFSASQQAFKELEERVEKYEYFEELKKDKRFTPTQAFEELEEEVEKYEKFKKEQSMK